MQAVPRNVNLGDQKPTAVASYVRRYRNIQTNSNGDNLQNAEIIIPIDTGTPGAFLDVAQSYFQATLKIINQNPYIDFVDLGVGGIAGFFEQLQIRCNGTGIETIRDYGTVVETWMKMEGIAQEEFKMYQTRKDSIGNAYFGANEMNSCKPPMVDLSGRIMHANSSVSTLGANANATQGSLLPTQQPAPAVQGPYGPNFSSAYTESTGLTAPFFNSTVRNYTYKPGLICNGMFDSSNINLWPQMIGITPSSDERISDKTSLRFQDYVQYLANVKNIPIGCTSLLQPKTTNSGPPGWIIPDSTLPGLGTGGTFAQGVFQYTFNIPLISGLIGVLQPKMVPTMLLDNFQLVLTTTANGKAMKVSMDPCRRIPGTHRDFLTYYGNDLGSMDGTSVAAAISANQTLPLAINDQKNITPNTYTGGNLATFFQPTIPITVPLTGVGMSGPTTSTSASINQALGWQYSFFPAGNLVPQYFQTSQKGASNNLPALQSTLYGTPLLPVGNDGHACYGTFLKNSVAQTARCIQNTQLSVAAAGVTYAQNFTDTYQGDLPHMPTFSITNVFYVAQQVILPDSVTAEILASAVHGDISMQSTSIEVYQNINCSAASGSQNIIIPAKCASANSMIALFRHPTQINISSKQYLVNSLCGYCPIGSAEYQKDTSSYIGTSNDPQAGTSGAGINYVSASIGSGGFTAQLTIGNDLVPLQPMTSIVEMISELEKVQHGLHTRYNNMAFGTNIIPNPLGGTTFQEAQPMVYDIFADNGYCTAFVDPFMLNDQTIGNNMSTSLLMPEKTNGYWTSANYSFVPVGAYMCNKFKHPDSSYLLGFDLDTWSAFSDVAMSGRYLGNNNVSLQLNGMKGLEKSTAVWQATFLITKDIRWSFQAGGNSQVFS